MDYSTEFIKLRDSIEDIYFTSSLEETILYIENLSKPFEFISEETMVIIWILRMNSFIFVV